MPTVLANFSISFTGEKSCKTDIKKEIIVSEHVYKVILPKEGKLLFTWIYNNQVMSTQSAFILTLREEWEATAEQRGCEGHEQDSKQAEEGGGFSENI